MASVGEIGSAQPVMPEPMPGTGPAPAGRVSAPLAGHGAPPPGSADAGFAPGRERPETLGARRSGIARFFHFVFVRPSWLAPLAVLACFGMSVVYVEAFNPTTGEDGPTGGCAFKALTGLDCPGCGGTRAFWYLLHGNLPEAARNHVLAVFAAPFLVYAYLFWALDRVFGIRLPRFRIPALALALFGGAWLAFFVLRNLPWAPFTYLYV